MRYILCVLCALAVAAGSFGQGWQQATDDAGARIFHAADGRTLAAYRSDTGHYYVYDSVQKRWLDINHSDCPHCPGIGQLDANGVINYGIDKSPPSMCAPHTGTGEPCPICPSPNAGSSVDGVVSDTGFARIVVVAQPQLRSAVIAQIRSSAGAFRDCPPAIIQGFGATDWQIKDGGYLTSPEPVVTVMSANGQDLGTFPRWSGNVQDIVDALRKADPKYTPNVPAIPSLAGVLSVMPEPKRLAQFGLLGLGALTAGVFYGVRRYLRRV